VHLCFILVTYVVVTNEMDNLDIVLVCSIVWVDKHWLRLQSCFTVFIGNTFSSFNSGKRLFCFSLLRHSACNYSAVHISAEGISWVSNTTVIRNQCTAVHYCTTSWYQVCREFLLETAFKYYHICCVKFITRLTKLLHIKYLFAPICAFHMYAVGYEVFHHPPFILIVLHSTGFKRRWINFNQCMLSIYVQDPHFLYPRIVLYTLSIKWNFVVCRHEPLLNLSVLWVKKVAEQCNIQ
jgi:hypothetical protein